MTSPPRIALGLAALVVAAAVPVAAASEAASVEAADRVDMAAVLKAAQLDPRKPDQSPTPGAADHVRKVEQALHDEGQLAQKWVDGHYGSQTLDAYTRFQRSLGYHGIAANGLPGEASLGELGKSRFIVTNAVRPGAKTKHGGKTVNARTKAMLVETERLTGQKLTLDQGSYSPGEDPTSAGTHDGGGAVDISVAGMGAKARTAVVKALRMVGFAAWHRTPSQGNWPAHIHGVAISDPDLSPPARNQIGDYFLGRNGLANQGPDDGPQVKKVTWEEYQR